MGKVRTILIHQLVMSVWGPPKPFPQSDFMISFKDNNKENLHIDNLKWILKGGKSGKPRKAIKATSQDDTSIVRFRTITETATYFHTNAAHIRKMINRKTVFRGYIFEDIK